MKPQNPQTSLIPVFNIGNQLIETLGLGGRNSLLQQAVSALRDVNVAESERRLDDFPHRAGNPQDMLGQSIHIP